MRWDVFCRVIDNFGDVGVCWRLSADLAARGDDVRLWIDDPAPLSWMAPRGAPGVTVARWSAETTWPEPAEVVIEAFGCALPAPFVARMARRHAQGRAPMWINLEYLSAEPYVSRSHRLPSPQLTGPGAGLDKWFFYPGFTPDTGGLLRETDLAQRQATFDAAAWREAHGIDTSGGERIVSLFCYDTAPVAALLEALAPQPTLVAATFGVAARLVAEALGPSLRAGALRAVTLPPLPQTEFDHLLWSSDINFVRGEDSFVRAMWAGRPFVWHIYPQADAVHARKLQAFNQRFLQGAPAPFAAQFESLSMVWDGLAHDAMRLPDAALWRQQATAWRQDMLRQDELVSRLRAMVGRTG